NSPEFNPRVAGLHDGMRDMLSYVFDQDNRAFSPEAMRSAEVGALRNDFINNGMSAYEGNNAPPGASHVVSSDDYDPGYESDFSGLEAEKARMGQPAEQQMRQQQAYDWMQGGNQHNA